MIQYIIKRLLWAIPTIIGVSIISFMLIRLAPGDPALTLLGERATKSAVENIRKELGLDKPLYIQYVIFVKNALKGDFGKSIFSYQDVTVEFMERFPATVELSIVAMLIAVIFGISAGIISAIKRYSLFDYISMTVALAGVSIPVFWLGLMLIYLFSVKLGWLPVSGRLSYQYYIPTVTGLYLIDTIIDKNFDAFFDALKHLILPAITLSTIPMSIIARITRNSILDVMKEEYILVAKAKGCSMFRVTMIHTLKNAMIPIITIVGLMFGTLFAGAVLTETTFSWPGIGKWLVTAAYRRDYPIIQFITLAIATIFIVLNLITDMTYTFFNPRVRLS